MAAIAAKTVRIATSVWCGVAVSRPRREHRPFTVHLLTETSYKYIDRYIASGQSGAPCAAGDVGAYVLPAMEARCTCLLSPSTTD